jgi:hypothetical protein
MHEEGFDPAFLLVIEHPWTLPHKKANQKTHMLVGRFDYAFLAV